MYSLPYCAPGALLSRNTSACWSAWEIEVISYIKQIRLVSWKTDVEEVNVKGENYILLFFMTIYLTEKQFSTTK